MSDNDRKYPRYHDVDGFRLPESFSPEVYREALKYQPQDGDLILATFPKCGTTWTQMLIYLIYHDGQPPLSNNDLFATSPFLEMTGKEAAEKRLKPGAIKVHLPFHLTPYSEKAKYIFVVRNPKDACVSFFHHTRLWGYCFEKGDFDTYFNIFVNGKNDFGDYFDHVMSWYERRNDQNVLFMYYEDMKRDIRKEIHKLARFMDEDIANKIEEDDDFLERIVSNSTVQSMKSLNASFNDPLKDFGGIDADLDKIPLPEGFKHFLKFIQRNPYQLDETLIETENRNFIRKGIVGDWKITFTQEQNKAMDAKIELKLKDTEMLKHWKDHGDL